MGNEYSKSEVEEDQDGPISNNESEFVEVKNGPGTLQSSPGIKGTDIVDTKQPVQQEKLITSSQKTIVISPMSNGVVTNLQTSPPPPAAKSKFSLAILRPAPGRTAFQSNNPEVSMQPEETLTKNQSVAPNSLETTKANENNDGVQILLPQSTMTTDEVSLSQTKPTEVESAPSKPKEISIFHKIFKPEKKGQLEEPFQPEIPEDQAITITVNTGLQSTPVSDNPQMQNIDDNKRATVEEQSLEAASVSDSPETISAGTQPTPSPEIHPVMSFFKTLVTPNKSVSKSEEEVKGDADDKSKKDEPQTSASSVVVEQPVVSLNSETSAPEQVLTQDPKSSDVPSQITASEDERKASKEPAAPRKLFWRKASAEPAQQSTKGDSEKTTAAGSKSQESQGKKPEDGKNSKPKLMMFFKQLTLDITDGVEVSKSEKTVVTAVVEPPPQKAKENMKEKKVSAEKLTKQDSRESPEAASSAQFHAPESVMVQNGGESSRDSQLKKTEKRQSLGSFFKAIGPKRMCDAEVQTDPVSILPAEKAK